MTDTIDWILDKHVAERKILVNVTGGKVPMSIGALMAAEERRVDVQYIDSTGYDREKNEFIPGTQRDVLLVNYP